MRRFDRLLVGLLVLAIVHVAVRDFSGSEPRRPAPEPAPRSERPLAPPSTGDPTVIVEAEPKHGNATGHGLFRRRRRRVADGAPCHQLVPAGVA